MTYEEWEASVHVRIKQETIWQFFGYRKALFLYDLAREDCERLRQDFRGRAIADQLIRSAGSVCANLEEGHGRGYGKERDWFFNVALASARETKGWYWRARRLLPRSVLEPAGPGGRNHRPHRHRTAPAAVSSPVPCPHLPPLTSNSPIL